MWPERAHDTAAQRLRALRYLAVLRTSRGRTRRTHLKILITLSQVNIWRHCQAPGSSGRTALSNACEAAELPLTVRHKIGTMP
jgi:hypothetical protein